MATANPQTFKCPWRSKAAARPVEITAARCELSKSHQEFWTKCQRSGCELLDRHPEDHIIKPIEKVAPEKPTPPAVPKPVIARGAIYAPELTEQAVKAFVAPALRAAAKADHLNEVDEKVLALEITCFEGEDGQVVVGAPDFAVDPGPEPPAGGGGQDSPFVPSRPRCRRQRQEAAA